MHIIIWEFLVKAGSEKKFEALYKNDGEWAQFFRGSEDYISTELYRELGNADWYTTIDKWKSQDAYESFIESHKKEYQEIDKRGKKLTEHEAVVGKYESG